MLLRSRRAISGESIASLQVFPKCRGGVEMLVDEHFVPDDGCEYSPSCLLCRLPVCKYDDPKKWGFQNMGIVQAKSRS